MKFLSHSKDILRVSQVTQHQLDDFLTQGRGARGIPFIVDDATQDWACMKQWSFDWLKKMYGHIKIVTADSLEGKVCMKGLLGDYIDYILEDNNTYQQNPKNFQYIDPATGTVIQAPLEAPQGPQYLIGWNLEPVYELTRDFHQPYFIQNRNLLDQLHPSISKVLFDRHNWIFVGPTGSRTQLHNDHDRVHTYLAQVLGKKHYILFSPSDALFVTELGDDGITKKRSCIDPLNPDLKKFPQFYEAEPYEVTIEPGDLLFLPSDWFHYAIGLEPSITVGKDSVDYLNFGRWFQSISVDSLPELMARILSKSAFFSYDDLPEWVREHPDFAKRRPANTIKRLLNVIK